MTAMIDIEPSKFVRKRGLEFKCYGVKKSLPFVESRKGEYTHRVRHATLHTSLGKSHFSADCWCGMAILVTPKKGRFVEQPSEGRPMCATCEGRAIGAGLLETQEIAGRLVKFSPRKGDKA